MSAVTLSESEVRRYMRQLVIQPFNSNGQEALKAGRALVVGAGGLGSPVIAYLAAAGIGHIGIADHDRVSISNLNRQIVYRSSDEGRSKADVAAAFAVALNPEVLALPVRDGIKKENALSLLSEYDVVIDGTDNLESRRLVAATSLQAGKRLVCGAIGQLEGFVTVFEPKGIRWPSGFESLFPSARLPQEASCEAVGTIGAVTGVIGSLMAMEAIKILTGMGQVMSGRVLRYDAMSGRIEETSVDRRQRYLVGG